MPEIVNLSNIYKSFGAVQALIDFNLSINEGEIVGLMGDNGAGQYISGSPTSPDPCYLYSDSGNYTVTLIIVDSNTCNDIKTICKPSPIREAIEPEKNYTEFYTDRLKSWQSLYQETKHFNQIKNNQNVT